MKFIARLVVTRDTCNILRILEKSLLLSIAFLKYVECSTEFLTLCPHACSHTGARAPRNGRVRRVDVSASAPDDVHPRARRRLRVLSSCGVRRRWRRPRRAASTRHHLIARCCSSALFLSVYH